MSKRKSDDELTESAAIDTPTGLTVYAVTGHTVMLTWNANLAADAIHIERSIDGEKWSEVVVSSAKAHSDGGLTPDTTYQYRAYAALGNERSLFSDVVTARTAAV